MTRTVLFLALLALIAPAMAGCQPEQERVPALGPGFGNAVQNNMAVQIINPVPPAETTAPDYDGRRAVSADERYRSGRVIQPATTSISGIGSGGTGGGGGGGAQGAAGVSAGGPSQ